MPSSSASRGDLGELLDERRELRIVLRVDASRPLGEREQQVAVVLDVGAKRVDVVVASAARVGAVAR